MSFDWKEADGFASFLVEQLEPDASLAVAYAILGKHNVRWLSYDRSDVSNAIENCVDNNAWHIPSDAEEERIIEQVMASRDWDEISFEYGWDDAYETTYDLVQETMRELGYARSADEEEDDE